MRFQSVVVLALAALASARHSSKRSWYTRAGANHHRALPHSNAKTTYATAIVDTNSTSPGASGCGSNSSWTPDETGHVNVTMGERSFLVHVPATYDASRAHPLVLSFHGFKANDVKQEEITGFSAKGLTINGTGLIAVYPNGAFGPGKTGDESIRAWEGAPYAAPGVDDITFVHDMVNALQANLCVDDKRMYASGKSNGGGFTNLLACTASTASMFAAFAPVSAALYPNTLATSSSCAPGRAVPIMNFHGLNDTIIPFKGQAGDAKGDSAYATPDIDSWRQLWASRNAAFCTNGTTSNITVSTKASMGPDGRIVAPKTKLAKSVSFPHKDTTLTTMLPNACSAAGSTSSAAKASAAKEKTAAAVHGFSVLDLGHSWPSTKGLDGGVTSFNATTANILPFFESQVLGS
ncbi:hypothetical protein HWV62_4341 [Athelia sp. TMB]|nr:hypothetical protein HWV62_4341 [Athelia sp. TMB]